MLGALAGLLAAYVQPRADDKPGPDVPALVTAEPSNPVADGWSTRIEDQGSADRDEGRGTRAPGTEATAGAPSSQPESAAAATSAAPTSAAAPSVIDDASLYERAIGALEAGQAEQGQHLLEQLVARSPASALADEARRRLAQIYATRFDGGQPAAAATAETAREAGASAPAEPVVPATGPVVISDQPAPWRERARRSHRFESMMSAEVGDRVFFGLSSSDVGARARIVLERQARWITRYPDLYIVVEGHSDDPGDDAANRALSLERADRARQLLIAAGIPADRIDVDARGRQDRLADCASAQCQAQNRRVLTRLMLVLPAGRGDRSSGGDGDREAGAGSRLATGGSPYLPGPRGDR